MAKREYVIRVANPVPYAPVRPIGHVGLPGIWVEQLRRLGVLTVVRAYDGEHTVGPDGQMMDGTEMLDIRCTEAGHNTQQWAEDNARRMQSFGINAVAAPKWDK